MANRRELFRFNLLPPKSREELSAVEERDDSMIYALLLVFFALFVYGGLLLTQMFLLEPRVAETREVIKLKNLQNLAYQPIKASNGELFVKSLTLEPLVEKDLDPVQIFAVADAIKAFDNRVGISSYSREASGEFVFEILSPSNVIVPSLLEKLAEQKGVSDVYLRSIDSSDQGVVRIITELKINV